MESPKGKLALITKKQSILKTPPKVVFKNGYKIVQGNQASETELKKRKDYYGNTINKEKTHKVFMNLSDNKIYIVENWKDYNQQIEKIAKKKGKCVIF